MRDRKYLLPTDERFLPCTLFVRQRRPFAIHDSINSCRIKSILILVNNETVPFPQQSTVLILCIDYDMTKIVVSLLLFFVFQNLDRNKLSCGRSIEHLKENLLTRSFWQARLIDQIPRRQSHCDREHQEPFPVPVQKRFERIHSVRIFQFHFLVKHFKEVPCRF